MARKIITEEMWKRIRPLLARHKNGRPRKEDRHMMEAILWVHRTGAPWRDLPEEYGPWKSVYTRFSRWTQQGVWDRMLTILKKRLRPRVVYD